MYLSRLLLNPRDRQVQRETADPYNLHRTILRAFNSDREAADVLHRLEINPRSGQMMLLVQSAVAPNWDWLVEKKYLLPVDPFSGLDNPAVKPINLSLPNGRFLQFRPYHQSQHQKSAPQRRWQTTQQQPRPLAA